MPFRRHFGFVFMENSQQLKTNSQKLQHTIAHELAHGAFGLEHPWQSKGTTQGNTYNLLDYTTKTPNNLLRKYQWYVIHNPRLSLFGGDEEEVSDVASDDNARFIVEVYSPYISHKFLSAFEIEDENNKNKRIKELLAHSLNTLFTKKQYQDIEKYTVDKNFLKGNLYVANIKVNYGIYNKGIVFYLLTGKELSNGKIKEPYYKERHPYGVKESTHSSPLIIVMDELIKQNKIIDFNNKVIKSFPGIILNGTGLVVSALTAETGLGWAGVVITADNLQASLVELYDAYEEIDNDKETDPKSYTFGGKLEKKILGKEYGAYKIIGIVVSGANARTGTLELYNKGGTLIKKVDVVIEATQTVKGASGITTD